MGNQKWTIPEESLKETIAGAYEYYYDTHYPQDNDVEGKEFVDVYIQGFEYAIVNGI